MKYEKLILQVWNILFEPLPCIPPHQNICVRLKVMSYVFISVFFSNVESLNVSHLQWLLFHVKCYISVWHALPFSVIFFIRPFASRPIHSSTQKTYTQKTTYSQRGRKKLIFSTNNILLIPHSTNNWYNIWWHRSIFFFFFNACFSSFTVALCFSFSIQFF